MFDLLRRLQIRHVEVGDDEAPSMEIPLAAVSRRWKPLENGRRVVLQKRRVAILDEATEQNSARTTGDAPAPTLRRLVRKQPEPAAYAASARRNGNPAGQASVDVGVARAAYRDEKEAFVQRSLMRLQLENTARSK